MLQMERGTSLQASLHLAKSSFPLERIIIRRIIWRPWQALKLLYSLQGEVAQKAMSEKWMKGVEMVRWTRLSWVGGGGSLPSYLLTGAAAPRFGLGPEGCPLTRILIHKGLLPSEIWQRRCSFFLLATFYRYLHEYLWVCFLSQCSCSISPHWSRRGHRQPCHMNPTHTGRPLLLLGCHTGVKSSRYQFNAMLSTKVPANSQAFPITSSWKGTTYFSWYL